MIVVRKQCRNSRSVFGKGQGMAFSKVQPIMNSYSCDTKNEIHFLVTSTGMLVPVLLVSSLFHFNRLSENLMLF